MGPTGSGKTSVSGGFLVTTIRDSPCCGQFINLASGSNLRVRMDLASCTAEVQLADEFTLSKRIVTLIDTPGFDDTSQSSPGTLKMIRTEPSSAFVISQSSCLNLSPDMGEGLRSPGSSISTAFLTPG